MMTGVSFLCLAPWEKDLQSAIRWCYLTTGIVVSSHYFPFAAVGRIWNLCTNF